MAVTEVLDVDLVTTIMRRFEQYDRRLDSIDADAARLRESMQMLAHHMRVACDAVAAVAEIVEEISGSPPTGAASG